MVDQMNNLAYPATFTPDEGGGYAVTFRDVPEATTQGDTFEDAKEMASFALAVAFEFYSEDNRELPKPSEAQEGEVLIELKQLQD